MNEGEHDVTVIWVETIVDSSRWRVEQRNIDVGTDSRIWLGNDEKITTSFVAQGGVRIREQNSVVEMDTN
jgi:hypothetical protein